MLKGLFEFLFKEKPDIKVSFKVSFMLVFALALCEILMIERFILLETVDLVRPPTESKSLVGVLDNLRLGTKLR